MKASLFENRFEDELLKNLPKDHVIIMDNAAFYTKEDLYQIAKKILAGTDFPAAVFTGINPIKRSWSALKRKIAGCIHRCDSVAQALDAVLEGN